MYPITKPINLQKYNRTESKNTMKHKSKTQRNNNPEIISQNRLKTYSDTTKTNIKSNMKQYEHLPKQCFYNNYVGNLTKDFESNNPSSIDILNYCGGYPIMRTEHVWPICPKHGPLMFIFQMTDHKKIKDISIIQLYMCASYIDDQIILHHDCNNKAESITVNFLTTTNTTTAYLTRRFYPTKKLTEVKNDDVLLLTKQYIKFDKTKFMYNSLYFQSSNYDKIELSHSSIKNDIKNNKSKKTEFGYIVDINKHNEEIIVTDTDINLNKEYNNEKIIHFSGIKKELNNIMILHHTHDIPEQLNTNNFSEYNIYDDGFGYIVLISNKHIKLILKNKPIILHMNYDLILKLH